MSNHAWETLAIAEIAEKVAMGPFGSSIKVETFVPSGVPVISGQHLRGNRLKDFDYNFVTFEHADRLSNSNVKPGDVIFTHAGNIGQVAYIPNNSKYKRYVISQRQFYVRPDQNKMLPEFLTYFFKTAEGQHRLKANSTPVGVPSIAQPASYIKTIEVPIPPLPEQRAIAHILGTLDDKIELNRRMNQTLEEIARALFKSWFVDFDPVHAKAAGRQPAGMDAETAALFPNEFEESELGSIPKGWRVGKIEFLCESITSGGTPSRSNPSFWTDGTIPWFKTGELHDGPLIESEEFISEDALTGSSCKLWPSGTILFALYASPTVGRLGLLTRQGTSNQAAAGLIAKQSFGIPFLRRVLLEARSVLQSIAVGAAQQNINQAVLKSHPILVPPEELAVKYSRSVQKPDDRQVSLAIESQEIASLRDYLLPMLISGSVSFQRSTISVA